MGPAWGQQRVSRGPAEGQGRHRVSIGSAPSDAGCKTRLDFKDKRVAPHFILMIGVPCFEEGDGDEVGARHRWAPFGARAL